MCPREEISHFCGMEWKRMSVRGEGLGLYVPDVAEVRQRYQAGGMDFPYWAQVWPAAHALASWLEEHAAFVSGKRVLELGAGLGLPSLVSEKLGASVHCTDLNAEAVELAQRSAGRNGCLRFRASVLDWKDYRPGDESVLLLSDANYDPAALSTLDRGIREALAAGITVLLSTPHRLAAREFISGLNPFLRDQCSYELNHEGKKVDVSVLRFEGSV